MLVGGSVEKVTGKVKELMGARQQGPSGAGELRPQGEANRMQS
jgi:hypothetical protein